MAKQTLKPGPEQGSGISTPTETNTPPVDVNVGANSSDQTPGDEVVKTGLPPVGQAPAVEKPLETESTEPVVEIKPDAFAHTVGDVSVQSMSTTTPPVDVNVGLTKVLISYPEDFNGERFYRNNHEAFVSMEVAEQIVKAGIGKIL